MAEATAELVGFAYGEELETTSGRSLGYRLLAPLAPTAWSAEVEALARRLQAAPYPDTWPTVDLFCSVLLAGGQRLVARARYGLSENTAARRRGGLELIGVVAPPDLGVPAALALYRWLGQRRSAEEDLHRLGGTHRLGDVLGATPVADSPRPDDVTTPVPVLPVRLWQEGVFLFAAAAPTDPDHHLRLLDLASTAQWQWLSLVGPDFPLAASAQRGPLVAWTPHLAGVAVRLDRNHPAPSPAPLRRSRRGRLLIVALLLGIAGLLGGNLWYMREVRQALGVAVAPSVSTPTRREADEVPPRTDLNRPTPDSADKRERFARALYSLLSEKEASREWKNDRAALLDRYDRLVRRYPDLAVRPDNEEGKLAVAAASVMGSRSPGRIDEAIRKALEGKGFSERVIQAARDHVREQLTGEVRER
jgi:hypothetical protein